MLVQCQVCLRTVWEGTSCTHGTSKPTQSSNDLIDGHWLEDLGWYRPNGEGSSWVIGIDRKSYFGLAWLNGKLDLLFNQGSGDLGDENNEARYWRSCTSKTELQELMRVMNIRP